MSLSVEQLTSFFHERLGVDTDLINGDSALFSSGLIDSFSMVELLLFIEQEGQLKIDPIDVNLDNLDSINRILNFLSGLSGNS